MLWTAALCSFVVAFVVLRVLLSRFGQFALDTPNQRSLHVKPVPRTGGIAVLAGIVVAVPVAGMRVWLPFALALVLAGLSLLDDFGRVRRRIRLLFHFLAAGVLVWYVLSPMNLLQMVIFILAVVWITNLYNFMDGADGVAGGMAVIGFGAYALAAGLAGQVALAAVCGAVSTAALAFLVHNFHPARIFLGDVGSIPLGFLVAALGMLGWRNDAWPLWFPLLAFGPFMGDATVTLIRRLVRREHLGQAHRDHYYQRIVRMGFGHRTAALMGYAAMLFCAAAAVFALGQPPAMQAITFGGAAAVLAAMALWVDLRWTRCNSKA
jgi:UDP-N-acetylmuramyl pentapeptide phosphotransferase/UDP-N-acetylglucosamine-1-phosphate transferase